MFLTVNRIDMHTTYRIIKIHNLKLVKEMV